MRNRRADGRRRYRVVDGKHSIELKLRTPHQLFDERDPAPFRERDLDDDAARYLLGSFRDAKSLGDVKVSLYFETMGEFRERPHVIIEAIHGFYHLFTNWLGILVFVHFARAKLVVRIGMVFNSDDARRISYHGLGCDVATNFYILI
jgi:hypothetical protein